MHSLGNINHHVGALVVRSETPNLGSLLLVPSELVSKTLSSDLDILSGGNFSVLDEEGEFFVEGATGSVDSVVFVLRLSHRGLTAFFSHSFLVGNDGVGSDDLALSVVLLQIVKADLNVELTATSNDLLSTLSELAEHQGVRFGEFLKTLDELGQIGGVFGLDSHTHDGGHGILH